MVEIDVMLQGFSTNTNEGSLAYCGVTLLRGERTTLVDVGYQARGALLLERLAKAGLDRMQIDRVVLTHAHWDHSFNLLLFPNAEVIISRTEFDYCQTPHPADWATPLFVQDIFRRAKQVTTVNDGEEIEKGVRVMAVPGHSPGSIAVLVETPDGVAGMVGDALPSMAAANAAEPSARLAFYDAEAAKRSGRKIVDSCRFIYPGHDRPFRMEAGVSHYIQPQSIVFVNPPRDEDGTMHASINPMPVPFEMIVEASARG